MGHGPQVELPRRGALALPLAAAAAVGVVSGPGAVRAAPSGADEPLGIGLEGWPYPGPVAFLPVSMGGETVRMAYMDFSPTAAASGRTVVLLHGKNFDSSYWAGPIDWLRGAGNRVVVPDQIGFNKSAKPNGGYSFEALARNTVALLAAHQFPILPPAAYEPFVTWRMRVALSGEFAPERFCRELLAFLR